MLSFIDSLRAGIYLACPSSMGQPTFSQSKYSDRLATLCIWVVFVCILLQWIIAAIFGFWRKSFRDRSFDGHKATNLAHNHSKFCKSSLPYWQVVSLLKLTPLLLQAWKIIRIQVTASLAKQYSLKTAKNCYLGSFPKQKHLVTVSLPKPELT